MINSPKLGLRILSMFLCLVCLCGSVRPVSAEESDMAQVPALQTAVVRNDASFRATVIGQMRDGTKVTVLDDCGDFFRIDCHDMTGYIAKSQLLHTEEEYYVNCQEGSSETRSMSTVGHAEALQLRHSLLELAKEQLGDPYVYGGKNPGGFDCSGLMSYLYRCHGVALHRTASQQLQDGIIVAREGMQVGDLVFFREAGETYPASHVGIYAGNNQIIHAGSKGIVYADLDFDYFYKYFLCARRIFNTDTVSLDAPAPAPQARMVSTRSTISGRTAN